MEVHGYLAVQYMQFSLVQLEEGFLFTGVQLMVACTLCVAAWYHAGDHAEFLGGGRFLMP